MIFPPVPAKLDLLTRAHRMSGFRSFADLGGCWGVNGAYALHCADLCGKELERAVIVDDHMPPLTRERAGERVELVTALLGSDAALDAVGRVDALIMYDILLHQAAPDWDEMLRLWCPQTETVVIWNPMWERRGGSVRFVDQGWRWYAENVYIHEDELVNRATVEEWFGRHDERDDRGRLERDSYAYWQWGIKPEDLRTVMAELAFDEVHCETYPHPTGRPFVNYGMIFSAR